MAKKIKTYEQQLKSFLIPILRHRSLYWYARNECIKRARVARGKYACAKCKGIFSRKQISVDHINPVINITTGWCGWDTFIHSLYCPVDNLQVLCRDKCHAAKTQKENEQRRKINDKKGEKK
jgi:hypothetical protein